MTPAIFLAALVLTAAIGFFAYYFSALRPRPGTLDWISLTDRPPFAFAHRRHKMERKDTLPILLITAVYAVTAFFQLGSMKAPQAYYDFADGVTHTIQINGDPIPVSRIWAYGSLGTGAYRLEVSEDGKTWSTLGTRTEKDQWGRDKTIYVWEDRAEGDFAISQNYIQLFKWQDIIPTEARSAQYIRLTGSPDARNHQNTLRLNKLLFLDAQGQAIPFDAMWDPGIFYRADLQAAGRAQLFTPDDTVPQTISWRNSSYFDEIYHPRTALEHLEGLNPYEITHPPLGKLIMAVGIQLFGMTPFGWRFMGTLFGVLMLPLLYVFLKNMFGKTVVAACGTTLFAAEFMHLTQTRIATIDTYGVFFILLSYWFFYRWLTASATPNKKGKTSEGYGSLALSGITWGIGCACKWTVVYAGVGLAILYLIHLILRIRAWKKAEKAEQTAPSEPAPEFSLEEELPLPAELSRYKAPRKKSLAGWLAKTLLLSVLCFVLIPLAIYTASYIPYALAQGNVDLTLGNTLSGFGRSFPVFWDNLWGYLRQGKDFQGPAIPRDSLSGIMLHNQHYMLTYHNGVTDPHSYASRWYMWLVDARPILFYLEDMGGGMTERFASFNNPLISWAGLLSLIAVAVRFVQRKCGKALFLVVAFLSQFLPWVFIGRTTFAYHYFPSILFLVFCICYLFNDLMDCQWAKWRLPVYGVTAVSVSLYLLFYPALIGLTMPVWYSHNLLQFLPSWPL